MIETVYLGRDNAIDLVLIADDAPVSLAALSRAVLQLGRTATIDSGVVGWGSGQPFDPTISGTYRGAPVEVLRLTLGAESIPPGRYGARLVVYDAGHADGLVWSDDQMVFHVKAA